MPMPSPSNYLRRTGAIADTFATNDRLLEIIVEMFHRGEYNKIRLANKAIAQFEAWNLSEPASIRRQLQPEDSMEAAIDRIMQTYALLVNR